MKALLTLMSLVLIPIVSSAQLFQKVYEQQYYYACESIDNSFVLAGKHFVNDSINNLSVLRVSAENGNPQLEYIYNVPGYDLWANIILETSDGGAYICGLLSESTFYGDPVILRIDECGNPLWLRNIESIICVDSIPTKLNWVNYACLDGNDGITFLIGLECSSLYCFNIDASGSVNWATAPLGEDSWMFSGSGFRRMENGNYLITGYQHTYWGDSILYGNTFKQNPALRIIDSTGNFIREQVYFQNAGGSMAYGVCDSWASEAFAVLSMGMPLEFNLLNVSTNLDSISMSTINSTDTLISYVPQDIFKGPKGQYYLMGNSSDTIPLLTSGIGVQLIDGNAQVLAQNTTEFNPYLSYQNGFVTSDMQVVILGGFSDHDDVEPASYDVDSYLIKFNSDLSYAGIIDTVTPESEVASSCGHDTSTVYFDLSEVLEESYAYTWYDTSLIVHEQLINPVRENAEVRIFPNPVRENATFIWTATDELMKISIVQSNGMQVATVVIENGEGNWVFNRNNLPAGLYAYCMDGSNGFQYSGILVFQ